ncbi:efflux RND transporter periplasmic adaptor subunit [bacterium]|nr:efflux RND transporter periplasmic adaptor subunit [bacterium]
MKKQKSRIWIWGILFLSLLLAAGNKILQAPRKSGSSRAAVRGSNALTVNGIVLAPAPLELHIPANGTLLAEESVSLRSEISGRIRKIHFREGARVAKGECLVKIEDADLQAQLLRLQVKEKLASEIEARHRQMLSSGAVSQEQYDAALSDLNMTRADRQFVEAQIAKTEIRAPFDGIVGLRHVSEGAIVGQSLAIAAMQNTSTIKIDFTVPEKYAGRIRTGSGIRFRIPGSDEWRTAKIYALEPEVDAATLTRRCRARCANPDGSLLPGSFVEIEVGLGLIPDAMTLQSGALMPSARGDKVLLVRSGKAVSRDVETGLRDSLRVQITGGLDFGDTVLLTGQMVIRPMTRVHVNLIPSSF